MVLEKATGKSLAKYFEEKIWKPMGATNNATWSLDSKKHTEAKAFCCINAIPEDFALFGQLYLHNGKVRMGMRLFRKDWINRDLVSSE
jgi:CubicO group peptidase (beta-lactamase class C family)